MDEPILYAHVHETPHLVRHVKVFCDDKEVKRCVSADVRRGECQVHVLDEDGCVVIEGPAGNQHAKREIIRGDIRIERID